MSGYTEALQSLGESARGGAPTNEATKVKPQDDWLDAYGQNDQKSWSDYYKKYKDQFSGEKATGYGQYAKDSAQGGNTSMQYLLNLQQRQMDERMKEYQDWQQKYWDQQNAQQEELLKWLRGDQDVPGGPGGPEVEWYQDNDFRGIAGIYAMEDPRWLNWAQGQDREGLEQAVLQSLQAAYGMSQEERDELAGRFGLSGGDWMQHLMYLGQHLGIQYSQPHPGPTPQPQPEPGQTPPGDWRQSEDYRRIAGYAAQVDPGNWAPEGWLSGEDAKRQAIDEAMAVIKHSTPEELDAMVRSWGVEGLTGQQWRDDILWLAKRLRMYR